MTSIPRAARRYIALPCPAALKDTAILWASLLILSGLAFFALHSPPARAWLWQHTGEEEFAAQVKGLSDLLSARLRPPLDLAPDVAMPDANVNPFGVNVFLEQEADPAKRELAVQMAAEAGYPLAAPGVSLGRYRNPRPGRF